MVLGVYYIVEHVTVFVIHRCFQWRATLILSLVQTKYPRYNPYIQYTKVIGATKSMVIYISSY